MSIYILDNNPAECAKMLDDKSLDKMIKDIAQVLCNVHHELSDYINDADYFDDDIPLCWSGHSLKHYKNAEWSSWATECNANYLYLVNLGLACSYEIEIHRKIRSNYNKKYAEILRWARENIPGDFHKCVSVSTLSCLGKCGLPMIMPKKFIKLCSDINGDATDNLPEFMVIQSYRNYYQAKLRQKPECFTIYTNRKKPEWITL